MFIKLILMTVPWGRYWYKDFFTFDLLKVTELVTPGILTLKTHLFTLKNLALHSLVGPMGVISDSEQ